MSRYQPDPKLDLVLERILDLTPAQVWAAYTQPELLMKWFTPAPWQTVKCEIDLRPGGRFLTVMRGPEGQEMAGDAGCFLEVVENEKLVWTDVLGPDYRPNKEGFFTAMILLEPHGSGTKYTAIALHKDEAGRESHEQMGFHAGWGATLDQLVALYAKV